ncbi:MAG TPA: hypothetical protein VFG83_17915 [Kofleriaceae bacterium]|nr:hypothetical protein [Kofleriaceae bacterium]
MKERGLGLVAMVMAGFSALRRYPGLALAIYLVQLGASALVGIAVTALVGAALGAYPILDRAAGGDPVALAGVIAEHPMIVAGAGAMVMVATVAYGLVSWFLYGGLIAVYRDEPRGRRVVAETFGRGGAATYLAYARLFALSAVGYVAVAIVFGVSMSAAGPRLFAALTTGEVIAAVLLGVGPAAVVLAVLWLIIDYARIDISRGAGVLRAAAHAVRMVFTSWRPAAFALLYYGAFAAVTAAAWWLFDQSVATAAGFAAIIAGRQIVSGVRFCARLVLIAGEVAYAEEQLPLAPAQTDD